jgi:hypothetical protein
MKINQLSVFLENKTGRLSEPCRILAEAGINILTMSLADTQQFGILRLIVKDWKKAKAALEKAGCVTNITEVIAVEVEDRPGGLVSLLQKIEQTHINVEYIYTFTFRRKGKATIVFRFENPDEAIEMLKSKGVNIIESIELYTQDSQE